MKRTILSLAALAACGGGGGDPAARVRGFIERIAAGDVARGQGYLPDDAACAKAPADKVERCKASAQRMRDAIPSLADDFPPGTKVTRVERSKEPSPDPSIV